MGEHLVLAQKVEGSNPSSPATTRRAARHARTALAAYHRRRSEAVEMLGGKCVVCGTSEYLELDHIDPATKAMPVGEMWSVSKDRYLAEIQKCQLLCRGHHIRKTIAERGQLLAKENHGTPRSYLYCKCDLCGAAQRRRMRDYRARRRERTGKDR